VKSERRGRGPQDEVDFTVQTYERVR
jgi:hypothetical protein